MAAGGYKDNRFVPEGDDFKVLTKRDSAECSDPTFSEELRSVVLWVLQIHLQHLSLDSEYGLGFVDLQYYHKTFDIAQTIVCGESMSAANATLTQEGLLGRVDLAYDEFRLFPDQFKCEIRNIIHNHVIPRIPHSGWEAFEALLHCTYHISRRIKSEDETAFTDVMSMEIATAYLAGAFNAFEEHEHFLQTHLKNLAEFDKAYEHVAIEELGDMFGSLGVGQPGDDWAA